ncbi:A/G-specific adenine glycosylase [bacterium]|jgi:A/G-specific adenine glycosylase|nr:A/G-specific adenine glycosylase [bacterium]MBT6832133.1 A/G-specific adenine glycosylase [bacterium]MBT6996421.1 A/G-specific adenine glycosylase [bacterium]MBT7772156.1 A/G-specific adenine glycosylase [bacterium]
MNDPKNFSAALENWYSKNGRDLAWRKTTDPYKIWISEIMLQQTQVPRVETKYFPQFLMKFPDVETLAAANWEKIFPVWRGLGFYSRGKNVLKTAKIIVKNFGGKFPHDRAELQKFPGIGEYTAAAIFAFSWDEKVAAIDTNVSKILKILWPAENVAQLAEKLVRDSKSGRDWNNAMMDLATKLRTGEKIDGDLGGFFPDEIRAKFLPARKKFEKNARSKKKWRLEIGIACIRHDGKYLIQTRPEGKSFTGQWEFPGGKREKGETLRACVQRECREELGVEVSVRPHFYEELIDFDKTQLLLRFHRCQIQKGTVESREEQKFDWVAPADFGKVDFLSTNAKALEKLRQMRV